MRLNVTFAFRAVQPRQNRNGRDRGQTSPFSSHHPMASSAPALRPASMRALLDVKLHGASNYALYTVALFDGALELTEEGSFRTTIIDLQSARSVKIVVKHGLQYVVIEMALKMKMPTLDSALRWYDELRCTPSISTDLYGDVLLSESPVSTADPTLFDEIPHLRHNKQSVPKRRIFSFPGRMLGVASFEDSASDSAFNSRATSVAMSKLSAV